MQMTPQILEKNFMDLIDDFNAKAGAGKVKENVAQTGLR